MLCLGVSAIFWIFGFWWYCLFGTIVSKGVSRKDVDLAEKFAMHKFDSPRMFFDDQNVIKEQSTTSMAGLMQPQETLHQITKKLLVCR